MKLDINGIECEVRFVSFDDYLQIVANDQVANGVCSYDRGVLYVSLQIIPDRQKVVFLHELIHAVLYHYAIHVPESKEEDFVDALSKALWSTIKHNPEILKYLGGRDGRNKNKKAK